MARKATATATKSEINVCNNHQLDSFLECGTLFNEEEMGLLGLQTQFTRSYRLIFYILDTTVSDYKAFKKRG